MSEVSLLVILDGFGYREDATDNAIRQAHTPTWDALWATRPQHLNFRLGRRRWTACRADGQFRGRPHDTWSRTRPAPRL